MTAHAPHDAGDAYEHPADRTIRFDRIDTAAFFAKQYRTDYLIEDMLAANQPALVAGGKKHLKTSLFVAAALALASGTPFLGRFKVPRPVRVGIMSGESGEAVLQETALRIASAYSIKAEHIGCLQWSFTLPKMGDKRQMDALRRFIEEDQLQALFLDPAYLMMPLKDDASNMFAVGEYLWPITQLMQDTGCTISLAHHTKKNPQKPNDPPELEDIAWAGFQEWARQWFLLGRRAKFDPEKPGSHKLWLNAGGSAGHSSLWALDVEEGQRKDPGGRHWDCKVLSPSMVRDCVSGNKAAQKARDREAVISNNAGTVLSVFMHYPDGATETTIRSGAGLSGERYGPVHLQLVETQAIERCKVQVPCGPGGGSRTVDGWRLTARGRMQAKPHRDTRTAA